jgi:hypothetical protein
MKEIKYNEDGTVTIDGEKYAKLGYFQQQKTKLEEARKRYPIGTNVKCLVGTNIVDKIIHHDTTRFVEINENNIWFQGENFGVKVYHSGIWAEIVPKPLHPTIEEIYENVKPMYFINSMGNIDEFEEGLRNPDAIPTKEDAEYILATMQLINIANYYNAKYPSDDKKYAFGLSINNVIHVYNIDIKAEHILFTNSAAKEALSNHNVIEVLNKYFRINQIVL